MKYLLSLAAAIMVTSVASATQLPASTFNEGETWYQNQLQIEAQNMPVQTKDWSEYNLADRIDLCLEQLGFWDHSTNNCTLPVAPPAEEVEANNVEATEEDAMALPEPEIAEETDEFIPTPPAETDMSRLADSTFNEGETWFDIEASY